MDEKALPIEAPAPAPPLEKAAEVASATDLAEMANNLYEAATKMQRDAEALMKAIREEAPVENAPAEKMTPEESEAASQAILGL